MKVQLSILNRLYLMGDQDCGVGLHCRDCYDGGRPLAHYDQHSNPYVGDSAVVAVTTIEELVIAAHDHVRRVHGK